MAVGGLLHGLVAPWVGCSMGWLLHGLVGWLLHGLVEWSVGWVVGWLFLACQV